MTMRPKGKHVGGVDPSHPEALGICDYTGFVHFRKDLIRQMEWRGNRLVWTGFLVGRDYLDKPNPQLKPPILKPDPVPVRDPREPQPYLITWNTLFEPWESIETNWESLGSLEDGMPALPENERLQQAQNAYFGSFG